MRLLSVALLVAALLIAADADAKRSAQAKYQFQKANPCPVNQAHRGRCPGYDIDHIVPLCAGGPDSPENMQWLAKSAHKEKTRRDVFDCRRARRLPPAAQ